MATKQKPLTPKPAGSRASPAAKRKITAKSPAAAAAARPARPGQKPRSRPKSLQQVKSLPQDFRFNAGADEIAEKSSVNGSNSLDLVAEEEEEEVSSSSFEVAREEEVVVRSEVEVNDESPYSLKIDGGSKINGGVESKKRVDDVCLSEDLPLRVDSRWSDTKSFDAKKVIWIFFFWGMHI